MDKVADGRAAYDRIVQFIRDRRESIGRNIIVTGYADRNERDYVNRLLVMPWIYGTAECAQSPNYTDWWKYYMLLPDMDSVAGRMRTNGIAKDALMVAGHLPTHRLRVRFYDGECGIRVMRLYDTVFGIQRGANSIVFADRDSDSLVSMYSGQPYSGKFRQSETPLSEVTPCDHPVIAEYLEAVAAHLPLIGELLDQSDRAYVKLAAGDESFSRYVRTREWENRPSGAGVVAKVVSTPLRGLGNFFNWVADLVDG